MTLTHTPTLTLAPALEAFAVRLENRDEGAWQTLLSQVSPVFGDPIAAQVAHLMKTYKTDGEYDGQLIRKMLLEKDVAKDLENDVTDSVAEELDSGEDEDNYERDYYATRTRYLETLDKNVLIDMLNMSEYEREYLIEDNM